MPGAAFYPRRSSRNGARQTQSEETGERARQHQVETAGWGERWPHAHHRVPRGVTAAARRGGGKSRQHHSIGEPWGQPLRKSGVPPGRPGGRGSPQAPSHLSHMLRAGMVDAEHVAGKGPEKTGCCAKDVGLILGRGSEPLAPSLGWPRSGQGMGTAQGDCTRGSAHVSRAGCPVLSSIQRGGEEG